MKWKLKIYRGSYLVINYRRMKHSEEVWLTDLLAPDGEETPRELLGVWISLAEFNALPEVELILVVESKK